MACKWWGRFVEHHRIDVIELTSAIAMRATRLPAVHKDPVDRFIIASAQEYNASVVTADRRFSEYGVRVLG